MKNHPPSARRSIPQQSFSTYLSCQRLRSVQKLLKQNEEVKDFPEVIVSILGIDGRYNEGCRELADYLLFGFFSLRQLELEKAGLEEEDIEDVIIIVRRDSVSVYCGFMLYSYLLPYIVHWPNLQIICSSLDPVDTERDADKEEDYKVRSFISMLEGCKNVGVPFLASSVVQHKEGADRTTYVKAIEKWPLIQSHALVGSKGSFTLNHVVTNAREPLLSLYYQCDPVVLEKTVKKSFLLFSRHWMEAVNTVNNAAAGDRLVQLQDEQVSEPLKCYFKHGQLSKLRSGKKSAAEVPPSNRQPFVLFGSQTNDSTKKTKPSTLKAIAGKGQSCAMHMVWQCVAPRSPITATRTYFIRPGGGVNIKGFNDLVHLYKTCAEACSAAIQEFTVVLNVEKAERKAIEHLLSAGLSTGLVFDAKCKISACDSVGRDVKVINGKQNPCMKVVRVAAENIKTSHAGDNMGSVVFADTFLDSSFSVFDDANEEPEPNEREATFTVLTHEIPNYMEWKVKPMERSQEKMSEVLTKLHDVQVCSNSALYSPPSLVSLTFDTDGKMTVACGRSEVVTVRGGMLFYDGVSPGKVALLVVNFDQPENAPLWNSVPSNLHTNVALTPDPAAPKTNRCLILALMPRSQAYKDFYAEVLHRSPSAESKVPAFKPLKVLSPDLTYMYDAIQAVHDKTAVLKRNTFLKTQTMQPHPKFSEFLAHYSVSSVIGEVPVPKSSVDFLLRKQDRVSAPADTQEREDKVCITILIGLPNAGAAELSSQLVNLNKEKVRWVVIRPTPACPGQGGTVDRDSFENQLAQVVSRKNPARPGVTGRKRLRIIVLAVGFFDLCDIVQGVCSHSDSSVRKQMFIGAVTACVRPGSVFLENKQAFPRFYSHCSSGLVSNFALLTAQVEAADGTDKDLAAVQSLVRNVNKSGAFLICHGGKLSRQSDFELVLSETAYSAKEMERERMMLWPALSLGKHSSGQCYPDIRDITIEFSQPLIKGSFCAKLRALKSTLVSDQPTGAVCFVLGHMTFTDNPSQEYELGFTTTVGEVELTPQVVQAQVPAPPSETRAKAKKYMIKFYGMNLDTEALKDWLRKCGRQKPSRKCHKTRGNMTKAELKAINDGNKTKPLPEGYFFNGSYFVNLFDEKKTMEHPSLQKFVDDFIAGKNKEIDAYNASIDRQNIKDVFGM